MKFGIRSLRDDQIQVEEATHWTGTTSVAWTAEQGGYPPSMELRMKLCISVHIKNYPNPSFKYSAKALHINTM